MRGSELQIIFERALRIYAVFPDFAVIILHRFLWFYLSVGDLAQHADEFQWMLGIFNPPAKQHDPRPVLPAVSQ